MALESVTAAERLIQSNAANDDLEDGEIPSDEDDEPLPPPTPVKAPDPAKSSKSESHRDRNSESKSSKSKSKSSTSTTVSGTGGGKSDRFTKYKNPSEDWAGDVEKAIKAALDGDNNKEEKSKGKGSSSRSKNRKRSRDEKEEERNKDQKKRRLSEDENGNEDEDEFMFVRGASPINRKDLHDGSPPRRSHENDNFDNNSDRDSEERSNRHRDEKRVSNRGSTPRRSGKNERTGKNKGRGSARNERNGRRNQITDHNQDPDSICLYFMQGKCHRGDDCPFSHNALPPRKMELCKFYLMDCCAKRDKCLYMHHDFPCKFHHTGLKCGAGSNCKFSHEPLNDQVKNILLKHLETAPKEILGDFPRLSRESALMMINHTARNHSQGLEDDSQKIPSLFDVSLTSPNAQGNTSSTDKDEDLSVDSQKRSNSSKEKKSANKKTRWGSDDDRVPLEQIVLLQTVNQLGLNLPNVALSLAMQQHQQMQQRLLIQQCIAANMDFYNEIQGNVLLEGKTKLTDGLKDSEELTSKSSEGHLISKDIDLRQLLANAMPKTPRILSLAEEAANLSKSKFDEESDREEESNLVIEVPVEEDDKNKDLEVDKKCKALEDGTNSQLDSRDSPVAKLSASGRETSTNLPKTAQEIFLRIQQQQKAAGDTLITSDEKLAVENALKDQEEWYSDESDRDNAAAAATAAADDNDDGDDDDDDDDDDDGHGNLQIVLKDNQKDEKSGRDNQYSSIEETPSLPSIILPQPAPIVDKLGDLSKIDISAEVTKLLSSIKPPLKRIFDDSSKNDEKSRTNSPDSSETLSSAVKLENEVLSPKSSPTTNTATVSRDPRMSRDPRQRRIEEIKSTSPSISDLRKTDSRTLRLETSIYSSGITSTDYTHGMDTDFRARSDQDHRRKDMDLRQRFQDFGDTDLRIGGFENGRSDVDLRQMLTLPFKPAPSHIPCTEIDASMASHLPLSYKVYVVDIPRPNYTGLKLTKNDAAVKHDPRLRKIFRLSNNDAPDSPMSPPQSKQIPDTPKSPPQLRADPRRKTLEISNQIPGNSMISGMPPNSGDLSIGLGSSVMPGPVLNMGMAQSSMLGGMNSISGMMNMPIQHTSGMPMGISQNGPSMQQNQLGLDSRFIQRNGGAGLLGPAPGLYSDVGPNYDQPFAGNNFNNFGSGANETMMGYGPSNQMNFGNNGPDWVGNSGANAGRNRGRVRRRNRNRSNPNNSSRGNRSPQ
ncbi:protein suppressor of sable isoform X2 [Fopius arisanus]|uniref:Protein suppressor of sable isoform X2 n=1 Tax=Fopius arisanus TaxID=64838 RepID=A0A9R1TH75_9HYME|nr:PREDICTED: protein suppressor of sable isoform X2 [Fopius arisanus]